MSAKKTKKPRRITALSEKMVDDAEKHGLYEALDLTAEQVREVERSAEVEEKPAADKGDLLGLGGVFAEAGKQVGDIEIKEMRRRAAIGRAKKPKKKRSK